MDTDPEDYKFKATLIYLVNFLANQDYLAKLSQKVSQAKKYQGRQARPSSGGRATKPREDGSLGVREAKSVPYKKEKWGREGPWGQA